SRIIDQYTKHESALHKYIFPELNGINQENDFIIFRKTKNATEKFNGHLKVVAQKAGISKKLTMHIARHSFGNIAGDRIHPLMLQKLYLHSDLKTTINYQAKFIHKEADEALLSIIE
ncbi:MAG: tyrosine-type recombinase/integrase, partial [Flavobacteriales bacterium]|nr:tyrosine-type recombinase/integrase [Flavobacteriales bacterium]